MLDIDLVTGCMWCPQQKTVFSDRSYIYRLLGSVGDAETMQDELRSRDVSSKKEEATVSGVFGRLGVALWQVFRVCETGIEETITLKNLNSRPVALSDIGLGFAAEIRSRPEWRLFAIPFRIQLDGSTHDYSMADLINGNFHNAVYHDDTRPGLPLTEDARLRSEAWGWWREDNGLLVIKYNSMDIELSVAAPISTGNEHLLRFGGVGSSLYGEPSRGHFLSPGGEFTFGTTHYIHIEGPIQNAFYCYRDFLDARGHCCPINYNPPVNWNELYDIGWYHSDEEKLSRHYTRDRLLLEAGKARDCGCELLYLDPGWEKAEGTTLWDEARLGTVADMIKVLRKDYGLQLGFRTVLRCYRGHWPHRHMLQHPGKPKVPMLDFEGQPYWELCLCDHSFWKQKLKRILKIVREGVSFLMVDEMDWRGPCHDPDHGHDVPTKPADHVRAVYALCRELRRLCPELTIECHDPVWPWYTCIYVPTYFNQGNAEGAAYHENWGFEYMWNCIEDLRSGKALALYYYNLGCNIPLYLHITMAADNDACLFFWWAASTIRHLGIGGMHGHESVNPMDMPAYDPQKRFAAYKKQMAIYRRLKAYFVRGTFHGLCEHIHLHTLPGHAGGVVVIFNLAQEDRVIEAYITHEQLQSTHPLPVKGAAGTYEYGKLKVTAVVPAMSPSVVCIGENL